MNASFVVHDKPARKSARNYIARADLAPYGFQGAYEQLWLKPLGEGLFEITCIPFQVYGLSLGDHVRLESTGTLVEELVQQSGHRTLRVLYEPSSGAYSLEEARESLGLTLDHLGLLCEWNADRLVAIDVPPARQLEGLFGVIESYVDDGKAYWEWSEAQMFMPR